MAFGDADKAIAEFTTAVKLDPRLAQAYLHRSQAYREKKQTKEADADYRQAVKLDPTLSKAK